MNAARLAIVLVLGSHLFTLCTSAALAGESGHLRAADLRCEYLREPLGVGEPSPRLTWIVESDRRAESQTAYRILVASSPERLGRDEGDLWDSGKVQSNATAHIVYTGKPLPSRQRCHWKIMAWDRDGVSGDWSRPAQWEMGLHSPEDWSAKWIEAGTNSTAIELASAAYYSTDGKVRKDVTSLVAAAAARGEPIIASNKALGGDPLPNVPKRLAIEYRRDGATLHADVAENATAVLARRPIPYLRKSFATTTHVDRARLYATALGLYELSLNGERIGDQRLAPGWTDYRKRVRYQVYDVTNQIARGPNILGAIVAPGWFSGRAGLFHAQQFYGKSPALLAQLEITYSDGTVDRIVSDESWRRHDGPILAADLMDGEIHDGRAEIAGWCATSLDDRDWMPVTVRDELRTLESTIDQPVRKLLELPARTLTESKAGQWTFDVSQNMVGVVRLRVRTAPGTVVTIRHGEMLNPDGPIYTTNLRGAAATDSYICKGGEVETWEPKFTCHGFRYVEITGLKEKPPLETVTGIVLGSDLPATGEFSCSDESLNRLQSNIIWGQRGNYVSIPTDCPQRDERMGWMADTQVFAPTAAFNADVAAFMSKWMIDVDDSQRADGAHSDVAPVMQGLTFGTPAWADAGTIVPWTIYQMYGDTRILERHIDSMMRWVDWCKQNSTGLIRDHARGNDYGDWLSINADTPKDLIGTAYFARSADIVARSLRALGRNSDADRYQQLFDDIRTAFIARYVDKEGRIVGDTQCCYALALRFNLLPDELRKNAVGRLVDDIQSKQWHLSTGFVGVGNLLPVLSEAGRTDVAYRLLLQDTFPSWLFSVKHGATTIWERWDGWTPERGVHPDASMNSFNHYSLGSCGEWLFAGVGGIEPDPKHPGFEHFIVRPRMNGSLTGASTKYRSIRGDISTRWTIAGDRLSLHVTIPSNTKATVFMPAAEGGEIRESGQEIASAEGVHLLRRVEDSAILSVGSGTYEFTSRLPAALSGKPSSPGIK